MKACSWISAASFFWVAKSDASSHSSRNASILGLLGQPHKGASSPLPRSALFVAGEEETTPVKAPT